MSRIRKDHIKLAEVIILDHFLQIYSNSIVIRLISPVGAFHISKSKARTSVLFHNRLPQGIFENILLTDDFFVTIYQLSYICGKRHLHKWRESGH